MPDHRVKTGDAPYHARIDETAAFGLNPRSERDLEPLGSSHFRVLINGDEVPFSFVGGLTSETDPAEEAERPDVHQWRRLVLRRAVTQSKDLFRWRQAVVEGRKDRREVRIEQHDPSGTGPVNAWVLHDAWPRRWSGPAFDAMTAAVAMEEIELCFDRVSWDYPNDDHTEGGRHGNRS